MNEFIRKFLLLRDGNYTPSESWLAKVGKGQNPKLTLGFVDLCERVSLDSFKEVLYVAAASECVYVQIDFRYEDERTLFSTCDNLLDALLIPLHHKGIIGKAVPLWTTNGAGQWLVYLFPIEAVPEHHVTTLSFKTILDAYLEGQTGRPASASVKRRKRIN